LEKGVGQGKKEFALNKPFKSLIGYKQHNSRLVITKYVVYTNQYYLTYHNYNNNKDNLKNEIAWIDEKTNLRNFYFYDLPTCLDQVERAIHYLASTDDWIEFSDATVNSLIKIYKNVADYLSPMQFEQQTDKRTASKVKGYLFEGINYSFLSNYYHASWPGMKGMSTWYETNNKGSPDVKVFRHRWLNIECEFRSAPKKKKHKYYSFNEDELKQALNADIVALTRMPMNKELQTCYCVVTGPPAGRNLMCHLLWVYTIFSDQLQAYHPIIKLLTSHY